MTPQVTPELSSDAMASFAAPPGSGVRLVVNKCPHCGEQPCLIEGAFRLHVSCENEKCPKRPRGRRQANIAMAVTSWNWQGEHGELYYDH